MKKNAFNTFLCAVLGTEIIFLFSCRTDVSEVNLIDSVTPLLQKIIKQQNDLKSESTVATQSEKSKAEKSSENETDLESSSDTEPETEPETPSEPEDTVPPEKPSDIKAVNHDGAVSLTWTDPAATDLFGIEIAFFAPSVSEASSPSISAASARVLSALEPSARIIAPGTQYAFFDALSNNVQYTFILTSLDTSGNRSLPAQKKITPKQIAVSPMSVKLSARNSDEEENSVKIEVEIKTKSPLYKVKYAPESRAVSYFKSRGTEIQETDGSYFFYVQEAGNYTVYARDTAGRQETAEITVKKVPL